MQEMDEAQALVTSIGEFTLETLGKENISQLSVTVDGTDCDLAVVLRDNSDQAQEEALRKIFEVEQVYFDDVVMNIDFSGSGERFFAQKDRVALYSYA
jgi:hypothetical protein